MTWLESFIYGLFSGIGELFPVSAEAHRLLFCTLTGVSDSHWHRLAVHLGVFFALSVICAPILSRLNRERRISRTPKSRRRRQPDTRSLLEIRVLNTALFPMILLIAVSYLFRQFTGKLWFLSLMLIINGALLYFPQFRPSANRDARSLSAVDSLSVGTAFGFGAIPGLSAIGLCASFGQTRGIERRYCLDIALMLGVIAMLVYLIIDILSLIFAASAFSWLVFLMMVTAAAASFLGAYFSAYFVKFLVVKTGLYGFAYYCWGLALAAFILYLTV